jgi:hypothetical protein
MAALAREIAAYEKAQDRLTSLASQEMGAAIQGTSLDMVLGMFGVSDLFGEIMSNYYGLLRAYEEICIQVVVKVTSVI